jgi:alkanesulfonate monooxygenase SsuD/methylene tetrahydromethanopterin reductase-like flavin-dependent oxidoreductase (luciferase family)/hemerythrin-like domain-containing protein
VDVPDYGHELEFGIFPTPQADRLDDILELVQLAEVEGLDIVSFQDHPYQARYLDTWTLLSVVGARTSAIKLAPNVANLPLRQPVVLAKSAATLDRITVGRVELGLGAGAFWDAVVAAGGPRRSPREAVDALVEAIGVLRAFWAGGTVRTDGTYYPVHGLHAGPSPAHDIPIWLGAYGRRMLRITGQLADAWVPSMGYADPPVLGEMTTRLDEAATAAGRGPELIRRIYNIVGQFAGGGGFLNGRPSDWAEQLAGLALEHGIGSFILGSDDPTTVRTFAAEVAPRVKELVAAERAQPKPDRQPAGAATAPRDGAAHLTGEHAGSADAAAVSSAESVRSRVHPTADSGWRLTSPMPWDEASRPSLDEPPDEAYTRQQQAAPQHLIDVHDGLRSELNQVRDLVGQVRSGHTTVGQARSMINTMTMRQNNWTLGAYCQSYCRVVTTHHTLEDRSIFPHLRRSEPATGAVMDRLQTEHEVIADVLNRLDEALVNIVGSDGTGVPGQEALDQFQYEVDVLTDTMLSHLAYEERELLGPLARHGFN